MIIVEGPDGAGKTTLIDTLKAATGLNVHSRASDSVGGPVENIYDWAQTDVDTWASQPMAIYDRHPLISELIYGPVARNFIDQAFFSEAATRTFHKFYKKSLIILCLPPFDVLSKNVHREAQMPGVLENLPELYEEYTMLLRTIPLDGNVVVYDYTSVEGFTKLINRVDEHITEKGHHFGN